VIGVRNDHFHSGLFYLPCASLAAICPPMTSLPQPCFISIAEYLDGEEKSPVKHEYLGGTVHAMAGATNQHDAVAISSIIAIGSQLRGKPCLPFNSDTKIRIEFPDHTRFYYPDAMVVCHPNPAAEQFQDQPVLIIEVLSDSTRRTDLGEKRDAYLTISSLKVLMFVESEIPRVNLYRRKPEGGFAFESHVGLDAVIPLPEIEASLPLAALYERVALKD
jgi:Uma2 family endonuclease